MASIGRSTVRRCSELPFVFVAVDQSSLSVVDHAQTKGFGHVGPHGQARGLQAMTSFAVGEDGGALGLVAQKWWSRPDKRSPTYSSDRRPPEERESGLWQSAMAESQRTFESVDSSCEQWFQLDRGADAGHVLLNAHESNILMTVRSAYDRCLAGEGRRLWPTVKSGKVRGRLRLQLARGRAKRQGRSRRKVIALSVRFQPVVLLIRDVVHREPTELPMMAVHVDERRPERGVERIEWLLLTTAPVRGLSDAMKVVEGYTYRWRVEELHRTWKTGRCNVESSQLRSPSAFRRWATLLAAVAARIERLKHLARNEPDSPALDELSRDEIDAAILVSKTKKWRRGDRLTIAQAVNLIASVGGYTGKSSGGPPGSITIGRGLETVGNVALGLRAARSDQ